MTATAAPMQREAIALLLGIAIRLRRCLRRTAGDEGRQALDIVVRRTIGLVRLTIVLIGLTLLTRYPAAADGCRDAAGSRVVRAAGRAARVVRVVHAAGRAVPRAVAAAADRIVRGRAANTARSCRNSAAPHRRRHSCRRCVARRLRAAGTAWSAGTVPAPPRSGGNNARHADSNSRPPPGRRMRSHRAQAGCISRRHDSRCREFSHPDRSIRRPASADCDSCRCGYDPASDACCCSDRFSWLACLPTPDSRGTRRVRGSLELQFNHVATALAPLAYAADRVPSARLASDRVPSDLCRSDRSRPDLCRSDSFSTPGRKQAPPLSRF